MDVVTIRPADSEAMELLDEHSDHELRQLLEEIQAAEAAFDHAAMGYQLSLGPIRFNAHVSSQLITRVYILFNALCFFAGIGLIFAGGLMATLGVALIVGGLFSFGAFVSQFWALAITRESQVAEMAGDYGGESLRSLHSRRVELHKRFEVFVDKLVTKEKPGSEAASNE